VAALLGLAVVAACGTSVDPAAQLREAGQAMTSIKTAAFDFKFGPGAAAFGFTLDSGSGKAHLPDATDTTLKASSGQTLLEFEVLTVAGHVYFRAPLIGFSELTGDRAAAIPDMTRVLDPAHGLASLIPRGKSPRYVGDESVDGHDCYHISATYSGAEVGDVIAVLKPTGDVDVNLWIDKSTHTVRRALMAGHLFETSRSSTLEVHLHDFDVPIDIQKPI
jgi:hypothetical protein